MLRKQKRNKLPTTTTITIFCHSLLCLCNLHKKSGVPDWVHRALVGSNSQALSECEPYILLYFFSDRTTCCILDAKQFYGKNYKNLQKAARKFVERTRKAGDIIIVPLDVDRLTDKEDINDDITNEVALHNDVPGEQ